MPRKAKPRTGKRPRTGSRGGAPPLPEGAIVPDDPGKESYVRALVERGEAARAGPSGELPPGATHEIVGTTASGAPIVVRRRFARA